MTTTIERVAAKLREKLATEDASAEQRKHKLVTKHVEQLRECERVNKERREAILAPFTDAVRKAATGLATDPPGIERVKGMARSG
jgi:hypothetical protein